MYTSMTGYGRARKEVPQGAISLEIYSVNHRYQEISVRLPRDFSSWEPWFQVRLKGAFRRGKLQLRLETAWSAVHKAGKVNKEVVLHFYNELEAIRCVGGECAPVSVENLLHLPGALDTQSMGDEQDCQAVLEELLSDAVSAWNEMRAAEGRNLECEVTRHIGEYAQWIGRISEQWAGAKDRAFEQTLTRVKDIVERSGCSFDDSRWIQEVAHMTDKWDVCEELGRIESHLKMFRGESESKDTSGKKLDFIVQELVRETNTLSSKVADAEIRGMVVEAKTSLERVREQIQNIE